MRPDLNRKEMCSMMDNLVADRRYRKGQLSGLVEALCRDFRQHDEEELTKLGARTQTLTMPEVEMTNRVCSGYRKTDKWFTSHEVRLTAPH